MYCTCTLGCTSSVCTPGIDLIVIVQCAFEILYFLIWYGCYSRYISDIVVDQPLYYCLVW